MSEDGCDYSIYVGVPGERKGEKSVTDSDAGKLAPFQETVNALILKFLPPEEFPGLKDSYGLKVRIFAAEILSAAEAWAEKRVKEALSLQRGLDRDQWKALSDSAKACRSCGLLWPEHKGGCGLWVRREEFESFRERAAKICEDGISIGEAKFQSGYFAAAIRSLPVAKGENK